MGILDSIIEFLDLDDENGPCCECLYQNSSSCDRFYKEKQYDRVNGTTTTYHSCADARSSNGFCGHKGKYYINRKEHDSWKTAQERFAQEKRDRNRPNDTPGQWG
jgi:hypothetical protein